MTEPKKMNLGGALTLVELFHQDDGHGLLDRNHLYTLRVSHGFDDSGNWVPQWARGFDSLPELRDAVFLLMRQGDVGILRATERFTPLAMELGFQPSVREGSPAFHPHQIVPLVEPPNGGSELWNGDHPENDEQREAA